MQWSSRPFACRCRTHDATVGKVISVTTKANQEMDVYQGLSSNTDLQLPGDNSSRLDVTGRQITHY
eukprot:281912-Amphidinium_carterae.1